MLLRTWLPYDWTPRSEAYFVFPLAQGTPGKQCGLAATGDYQPSLRSPWLAADADDKVCLFPGSVFQWVGVKARAGAQSDALAAGLRALLEPSVTDSPHDLIYQWVDDVYKHRGSLPTKDELVEFVMDYGWHADDVPQEVIDRIERAETKSK